MSLPKPTITGLGHADMIKLGSTIKYIREAKGLKQREAATVLGISDVHLCNLEHDKARPSTNLVIKIQQMWNVDLHILSWCLHGDLKRLPEAVRQPMEELARAWRSEFDRQGILRED